MLKESIRRGLLGILAGVFVHSTILTITAIGTKSLTLDSKQLIAFYLAYAGFGFFYAAISIIFNTEWSMLKKMAIHAGLSAPAVYMAYKIFVSHEKFAWLFISIYFVCYGISFMIYLLQLKKETRIINAKL